MQATNLIPFFCGLVATLQLSVHAGQATNVAAKTGTNATSYVRLTRDSRGEPRALETAIVRFAAPKRTFPGLTIDLVAAVHVGEQEYYKQLEREFDQYDAVLYELVGGGDRAPASSSPQPGIHAVAMLQRGLKDFLQLHHQIEQIDYSRTNFIHADMSFNDFKETMAKRGETFLGMFLRLMNKAMAEQNQGTAGTSDLELLAALFSPNRSLIIKRYMAEQFDQIEAAVNEINGPDGSTILTERNKVAMRVLDREIARGRKRIAIFYGAAHMPDFETRLTQELQMRRISQRWFTAWDLRTKAQRENSKKPTSSTLR